MISLKNNEYTYSVGDLLGAGAFGSVYKCKKTVENKYYALKLINR